MLAKDVMRKRVVSLTPDMALDKAAQLFAERGISGAPVVSPEGELMGVLSRTDLAGRADSGSMRVEQAMTPWGVSFEEDTPLRELARQMLAKRIHRVIITRQGHICGIVTSMDMLKALLSLLEK